MITPPLSRPSYDTNQQSPSPPTPTPSTVKTVRFNIPKPYTEPPLSPTEITIQTPKTNIPKPQKKIQKLTTQQAINLTKHKHETQQTTIITRFYQLNQKNQKTKTEKEELAILKEKPEIQTIIQNEKNMKTCGKSLGCCLLATLTIISITTT